MTAQEYTRVLPFILGIETLPDMGSNELDPIKIR